VKKRTIWLWIVCLPALTGITVFMKSVETRAENFQADIDFVIGSPKGEFRDNLDRNGYGLSLGGLFKPGVSPLGFGIEFGFMNYGHDSRDEPLSTTIPDLTVRVENTNNIVSGGLILRLQPYRSFLSPYVDGLLGFKYIYTETTIKNLGSWGEDEEIASSKNLDDITYYYGIGGGVMFLIYRFENVDENIGSLDLNLDIKCRYIIGGEAEYLKEGSIRRVDGKVKYDIHKSDTEMMMFHIGLSVVF